MYRVILSLLIALSNLLLLLFTLRRWLFLWVVWQQKRSLGQRNRRRKPIDNLPSLLILTAIHNEQLNLPHLLLCLENLSYPLQNLTIVLIDDSSNDNSGRICRQWAKDKPHTKLLSLHSNQGKAQALNIALTHFPEHPFVAILDADERPDPDTLLHLMKPFSDPAVAAVTGRRAIHNAPNTPISTYATYENLVHQLVTVHAKQLLSLAPPILGSNCIYRRSALNLIGRFKPGALLEDSDLTLRLARAGWQTRYEPGAVSYHAVPDTITGYWRQRTRWSAGFQAIAEDQGLATLETKSIPLRLRVELFFFSLGYLDRLGLLIALFGRLLSKKRAWLQSTNIALNLLTPLAQILFVLRQTNADRNLWLRLPYLPLFYLIDLAAAIYGLIKKKIGSTIIWEQREYS